MISEIQIDNQSTSISFTAQKAFEKATRILFITGITGQFIFVAYIVLIYGGIALSGDYERINKILPHGIIAGDTMGNFALAIHLLLAAVITFGGPLQFIKGIRQRFPRFHRWNGRIYYVTAFIIASTGLIMNATRGAHGGMVMALGNALNAMLIMTFSVMAWRTALQKNFKAHKKWAIRAFLMVSGVWFFRIGYGLWILLTGFTAPGVNADLNGPFDIFLGYGHSLVPLLIIETYFRVKNIDRPDIKKIATYSLYLLSLLLAAGIIMVGVVFWLPLL